MPLESSRRTRARANAAPRKGDLQEQKILDATERLLERIPLADLTIDEIARASGLSRPSVYFYFESKETVLRALHERMHRMQIGVIRKTWDATGSHDFRTALEEVFGNWRRHGPALRSFFETAMVSADFGARYRAGIDLAIDEFAAWIDAARAAGRAAPGPPAARDLAAAITWSMQHNIYELFRRKHTLEEERTLIDTLVTLFERSLGAPAAGARRTVRRR